MSIYEQNNHLAVCDDGECDRAGRKSTQMMIAFLKRRSINSKIEVFELPYIAMISIFYVFVLSYEK